jgi:glycosyltransferase involved in cell wall biosynthesis
MNRAERRRAEREGKTTDPAAILWMSNAMWTNTGYSTQTSQAVKRLQRDGHAVAVAANYGLAAMTTVYDGIPHFPQGYETYSNDVVEPYFKDWTRQHPDHKPLCIVLFDAWPLKGPAWDRMPVAIWTMIDHLPAPPAVMEFLKKPNVTPLAASGFAHEQIQRAGVDSIYVPMAIDTNLYKPTATWNNGTKPMTGRELMGFTEPGAEDLFVVSCVNANKSGSGVHRKAWGENILAFSIFAQRHDDVRLYIHTEKSGAHGGVMLEPLLAAVGLKEHQYRIVNSYAYHLGIPNEAMAALFTATDVLLAPTLGEGFGLTVAEAGACETPAIVSDFTCQPELVSADSFLVGGQPFWDSLQAAWWQTPSVPEIVDALEAAYARGRFRSTAQREHIIANFDADTVYEKHWKPALAQLLAEPSAAIEPLPEVAPEVVATASDHAPHLTIYVPTYRRASLADTLASLAPQLTAEVEVIVADNDPDESGRAATFAHLSDLPASVTYLPRGTNIGGDENLLRGLSAGSAPWVWMIGDDDRVLPGAVANVLEAISHDDIDRLILLSPDAPSGAAGMIGSPADLERAQPGLLVASTLITANVVRRSMLDLSLGRQRISTMYGWAWAHTPCRRVKVLASPAFVAGSNHAGEYAAQAGFTGDPVLIWTDLLTQGYDVVPTPASFSWNHLSVPA